MKYWNDGVRLCYLMDLYVCVLKHDWKIAKCERQGEEYIVHVTNPSPPKTMSIRLTPII